MGKSHGFTFVETTVAAGILAVAAIALVSLFVSSIKMNAASGQRTTAAILLSDKIEQLANAPLSSAEWNVGGALSAVSPAAGYFEYATLDQTAVLTSTTDATLPFLRVWQISGTQLRTATVILFANMRQAGGSPSELARTSIKVARKW